MKLEDCLRDFIAEDLLDKDDVFIIAVSGGRDSIALLAGLLEVGFSAIEVCHLNHSLRGNESDADEEFVRNFCERENLCFHTIKVKVSEQEGSMELAARNARYHFFSEVYKESAAKGIFLGHHADDQAETILFNLFRGGTGLQGMKKSSIRCENGVNMKLMRPLLEIRRSEITEYLEASGQSFREDSSNKEAVAVRNQIRNQLIPLVNEIMSRDVVTLVNQAEALVTEQRSCFEDAIDFASFLDPQGRLFLPKLENTHPAELKHILSKYLQSHTVPNISADLIERATQLIHNESISKLNLPSGRYLRRKEKRIFIDG